MKTSWHVIHDKFPLKKALVHVYVLIWRAVISLSLSEVIQNFRTLFQKTPVNSFLCNITYIVYLGCPLIQLDTGKAEEKNELKFHYFAGLSVLVSA